MTSTAELIADYTSRFSGRYATRHSAASGLGLWLLLALLAPAVDEPARTQLEVQLGTDAGDAAARAAELLARPHPAVLAATALWSRPEELTAAFSAWSASLPLSVEQGPMPDQAGADAWADRHTRGMIPRFPARVAPDTLVVLASALATDVTWAQPFSRVPAARLGGVFGALLTTALEATPQHRQLIAETESAGLVAVHVAEAEAGLAVISAIGAPDVAPATMHEAIAEVATLISGGAGSASVVDLFDLPLGDGHAWTLTEEERRQLGGPDRTQAVTSILAAWTAAGDHDLRGAPGMAEVVEAVTGFMDHPREDAAVEAHQSAFAQYTRTGFRAAAVTAILGRAVSLVDVHVVVHRQAEVRFNRPHAVLALALGGTSGPTPWADVPVFSAWVAEVQDPAEDESLIDRRRG